MSRILRTLLCLLLICCILVNCSPIRAEAVVAEAAVVTGTGVFATLFAMAMGVVFVDLTAQLINGMGRSLENHLSSTTTEEETEILKVWIEPLKVDFDGGISQDPEDPDDDGSGSGALAGLFSLPGELLDNLFSWGSDLINGEGVKAEDFNKPASEGMLYYGTYLYPVLPEYDISAYPYALIYQYFHTTNPIYLYLSSEPFVVKEVQSSTGKVRFSTPTGKLLRYEYSSGAWNFIDERYDSSTNLKTIHWSSYDLYKGSALVRAGTEPTTFKPITVYPNTYVGDIPQQIQDGTFEEEKYELPYINYNQIFQGQTDTVAALNNVATQLQNQTLTYEQYMEQIRTEVDTNTGTDSGTTTDPWSPPSDPGAFALDLTNYFPFCIPFDLYDFLSCLAAEPEAPVISWELPIPGGSTFPIELDLSPFDPVAQLLRRLELLLFIVGLAIKTRDLIKG